LVIIDSTPIVDEEDKDGEVEYNSKGKFKILTIYNLKTYGCPLIKIKDDIA